MTLVVPLMIIIISALYQPVNSFLSAWNVVLGVWAVSRCKNRCHLEAPDKCSDFQSRPVLQPALLPF